MYLRYRAQFFNEQAQKVEFGFFAAADYLKYYVDVSVTERKELESLIDWFDNTLPIPDYYQNPKNRQKSKAATSWFKDSAAHFIESMNQMSEILKNYNVLVERIHEKKMIGKVIYEDEFQITVIPYKDEAKRVK